MSGAVGTFLAEAEARLRQAGIGEPRREALLLLAHATGLDRTALRLHPGRTIDAGEFDRFLGRRVAREPMAHIIGRQGFWTLDLEVSPATLIPRADSETVIEAALAAFPESDGVRRILDLGTGTGCLLLAALAEFPRAFGIGVDLSPMAVALARRNASSNGLAGRCSFLTGDWAEALQGDFDLILSNPPYIPTADLAGLMPEVRRYEPVSALDGGGTGLEAYRRIIGALTRLIPQGKAIFEIGIGQQGQIAGLARAAGWTVSSRRDLGGVIRALVLEPA